MLSPNRCRLSPSVSSNRPFICGPRALVIREKCEEAISSDGHDLWSVAGSLVDVAVQWSVSLSVL